MKIHMVKKGESLYEIAQKYHIELDKLIAANPQIADPNVIDVGMKVKIPNETNPATPPTDYLYKHTVVQGDSLWKLGKAWGVPLADMVAANPQLKNPNVLMTGDIVYIPKLKPETNPSPHGNPATSPAAGPKADTSQVLPIEAAPISELPETPAQAPTDVAPVMEAPTSPTVPNLPNVPNIHPFPNIEFPAASPMPGLEGVHHAEANENMNHPFPNWGIHEQPAQHPFQQFQMPAVEAMTHEQPFGKGKENAWTPPELPGMPTMESMPMMQSMPSMSGMPMTHAAEMPHFGGQPQSGFPMFGHPSGGDCGCGGGPALPYAEQPSVMPAMMQPNEPFLAPQAYFPHHMPMMPYVAEPMAYPGAYPAAGVSGFPHEPFYPGHVASPFGMHMPWSGSENEHIGGKEQVAAASKSRGEKAEITQVKEPASSKKKAPARKNKQSSARAAISSLIARSNRRAAQASTRSSKASPWLSR